MISKPAAFVFDMDGVLVDSHPAHLSAWREFLASLGVRVCESELSFILEGRTRAEILRRFLGDLSDDELQFYGRRKDEIFRSVEPQILPVRGAIALLNLLSSGHRKMAVATSGSEIRTLATIERLGMGGCFDVVVTAADVAAGKPDPAVYQMACERLEVKPQQALAFDDALAGVQAACTAGMRCIGIATNGAGQRLLNAGAEAVIPDFDSLEFQALANDLV